MDIMSDAVNAYVTENGLNIEMAVPMPELCEQETSAVAENETEAMTVVNDLDQNPPDLFGINDRIRMWLSLKET